MSRKQEVKTAVKVILVFCFLFCACNYSAAEEGLVACWKFDEGTGNVVKDSSGNGNDGTIYGDANWVSGIKGSALHFNGKNSFVKIPAFGKVIPVKDISVSVWVKLDKPQTGPRIMFILDTNSAPSVIDKYFFSDNQFFCLMPRSHDYGVCWAFGNPAVVGGARWMENAEIFFDDWHQLVFVAGEFMKIYLDGEYYFYGWSQDEVNKFTRCPADLYLGGLPALKNNFFAGSLDELTIFDRALTPEEIKTLYQKEKKTK